MWETGKFVRAYRQQQMSRPKGKYRGQKRLPVILGIKEGFWGQLKIDKVVLGDIW